MKLPTEGALWFVRLRWAACALVFLAVWLASLLSVVQSTIPLYVVGLLMAVYNATFWLIQRHWGPAQQSVERNVALQMLCDVLALTALLYFSDLPQNPFLFFFVLPMIIAGMYLRGATPYLFGLLVTVLVGGYMLLEHVGWLHRFPLHFSGAPVEKVTGFYLLALFVAFDGTLWITLYFATTIRAYVDRAHAEIRQKEKMLGIGQLVAGIGHQIANPLDGVQNCLRRIGDRVKDDAHLTEYVQMMEEALDRIEKTTKRVQSFARPRGISLQQTSVNSAIEATLQLVEPQFGDGIHVVRELGEVPPVCGDPYTLQEVLFNLCMNAMAAMPNGGTLTVRSSIIGPHDDGDPGDVAIEVSDTGVGIPRGQFEKVFEPFYTTRSDSGGTGLGLGLCRMLMAEMNGRIHVQSELNVGSAFTVIMPRAKNATRETS